VEKVDSAESIDAKSPKKIKTMSDKKHSDSLITNEDTLQRRDWIERALAGVRGQAVAKQQDLPKASRSRPRLYVVGSRSR
jgi:hypothetical protein